MSLQARYSFYTKLYKKYSPDLSDEEIGQEVRNLSHAENQQESIDNFYKNVVGKPVTTDQRIKISQFVDPQATKGIIDKENAKIKAENEALKLKNKEDIAARTKELEESIKKAESEKKIFGGDYQPKDLTNMSYDDKLNYLKELNIDEYDQQYGDNKFQDTVEEKFEYVSSMISGLWRSDVKFKDLTNFARTKEELVRQQNNKERKTLENLQKNPNYMSDTNTAIADKVEELQNKQKNLSKDSEEYKKIQQEIKDTESQRVDNLNVYKTVEVEDFKDAYDNLVKTGSQIGRDGQGISLFGGQKNKNFPTLEEYLQKNMGNPSQYETFKALNDINLDADVIENIALDAFKDTGFNRQSIKTAIAENSSQIQEIANRNDLDYEDVVAKMENTVTSGVPELTKIFQPLRDVQEEKYNKFLENQGFVRDNWMDDEFVKYVFPDASDDLKKEVVQGKVLNVGVTEAAKAQYQQYLPNDIEELITNVRTSGDAVKDDEIELTKKQELLDTIDESLMSAIGGDSEIRAELDKLSKAAKPQLLSYKKELEAKYDMSNMGDVAKVNELLAQRQNELTLQKLIETPTFKRRSNEIGMAFGAISKDLGQDFTRQQSFFLRTMDSIYDQRDFDSYNPFNWVGEVALGIGSGVEGITSAIGDSAVASVEGFVVRQKQKLEDGLQEALDSGEIKPEDNVVYEFGKWIKSDRVDGLGPMNAKDKLEQIKKDKNYWNESIAKQMQELARSDRRMEAYGGANFEDGISLQDAFATLGQALPHIGLAAAGGLSSGLTTGALSTTLGYLGTVTMGLQMYGDNYMSAIQNNLKKNGKSKEDIIKQHPEWTEKEVDEEYRKNLAENFQSGEGANIAKAAAAAGAQALLERYGAEQMVGATQKALRSSSTTAGLGSISLFDATFDEAGQYVLDVLINSSGSALKEFGTEYAQEIIGQISQGAQADNGDLFKYVDQNEALQAGIGGAITGFALPFFGATGKETASMIRVGAAKVNLFNGKNAYEISKKWYEQSKAEVEDDYKNKKINKKEYYQRLKALAASSNAGIKLKQGDFTNDMLPENRFALHDLLVDIETMQQQIQDADGNKPLQDALKQELTVLNTAATDIIVTEREVSALKKIAKDKGFSNEVQVLDTEQDVKARMKELGLKYDPESTGQYDPESGNIIMNRKASIDLSEGRTAGHELMHKVLFNTLYKVGKDGTIEGKNVVQGLTNVLDEYLQDLEIDNVKLQDGSDINMLTDERSIYQRKLALYKESPETMRAEEKFTLFRDALANGDIKFNENFGTKIGDVIRRLLNAVGMRDIKFNDGRDVYNFIKDFNYDFEKGKLSKSIDKLRTEGAEVGENIERIQDDENLGTRKNKSFSQLANDYKTNPADADVEQLIKEYRNVALKALQYNRAKGTIDSKEAVSFVDSQFESIVKRYDGSTDFSTWVNANIRPKQQRFYEGEIGKSAKTTSIDDSRARQVVDETSNKEFDEVAKENKGREKVYSSQTDQVGNLDTAETKAIIKDEVSKDILLAANKGKNAADTARDIANESKKNYFKRLRTDIGTFSSQKYKDFVNSLDKNFIKSLPVATIKRRFGKLFGIKQTGTTPTKQTSKTGKPSYFNKQVFSVPKVTAQGLQDFKDYFLGGEKRQQSLYNILATDFALESIQELMADKTFMKKLESALGDSGITAQEFMQNIENKLDGRTVEAKSLDVVKANKSLKASIKFDELTEYKEFGINDLTDLLKLEKVPTKKIDDEGKFTKAGKQKTKSVRDFDAIFPGEETKTYREVSNEVINDFLSGLPTAKAIIFREILRNSIRSSKRTMYNTLPEFDAAIPVIKGSLGSKSAGSVKEAKLARAIRQRYKTQRSTKKVELGHLNPDFDYESQEFLDNENLKIPELIDIFKNIGDFLLKETVLEDGKTIQENLKYFSVFDAMMDDTTNNQNHFVRYLAPINFLPIDPRTSKIIYNQKIAEEHTLPASSLGRMLLYASVTNQLDLIKPVVEAAYMQGALLHVDDVKLNNNGLKSSMDAQFNSIFQALIKGDITGVEQGLASLSRYTSGGFIDPNGYYLIKQGMTIAEYYGVDLPFKQQTPDAIKAQLEAINAQLRGLSKAEAVARFNAKMAELIPAKNKQNKVLTQQFSPKLADNTSTEQKIKVLGDYDTTLKRSRALNTKPKGISVFDFDDTLAKTKEKVIVTDVNGNVSEISAAKFAEQAIELEESGATFDFTNFENVSKGTQKGPLADLALRRQGKFGSEDIFVLTARPQIAATSIKTFLDGIGLNIPLKNITGLEDGSPQAKADWVISKTAEGYNDFYFADDAIGNVKAVKEILDQVDVKSDVQLVKASKGETFDKVMNDIIEGSTGIKSEAEYSKARAQTVGAKKGRFTFFTTPSAEDFVGLIYKFLGKGKVGDAQLQFFQDNLIDPYNRAELAVTRAKISAANDFRALKKSLKTLPKSLSKQTGIGGFTFGQAARVAVWTRQGMEVPGLSKRDAKELNDFVSNNAELDVFVDELISIQKGKLYPKPGQNWLAGNITSDIVNEINKVNRKEYMQVFNENLDIIFSDKVMNKLEAAYGPRYVEALRDMFRRMKSGSNRPVGNSRIVDGLLNWLNNSVGAIMFLNTRTAVLQTISAVNFINFGNNNIIAAAKAFANQKQYWKDFMTLMNSPYLVERRDGLKINVSESEIADAVSESSNKPKAFLNLLLSKGFVLTRIADSFAIAAGGSTFYRNQIKAYMKSGMDQKAAEKQAFDDFYAVAETSQQSSNPSKISQQQASGAGRVILAFANTPMQYNRIIKRATQDLINGRGDWKTNVSKIVYYGAIQNLIFNALQNALFALAFGEEEEEKEDKTGRIANGMADSLLRGLGIQGAAVVAVKDALITIYKQANKEKGAPEFRKAIADLFGFSPPLDSKVRKLNSGLNTLSWEREKMSQEGFNLNNPAYLAYAQVLAGLTNIPLDRAIQKINNLRAVTSDSSAKWQKVALLMGWSTWDLGLPYYGVEDKEVQTPKTILRDKVLKMKKETSTKEQKEILLELGLTKQQIKALKYENERIKKIIELQK